MWVLRILWSNISYPCGFHISFLFVSTLLSLTYFSNICLHICHELIISVSKFQIVRKKKEMSFPTISRVCVDPESWLSVPSYAPLQPYYPTATSKPCGKRERHNSVDCFPSKQDSHHGQRSCPVIHPSSHSLIHQLPVVYYGPSSLWGSGHTKRITHRPVSATGTDWVAQETITVSVTINRCGPGVCTTGVLQLGLRYGEVRGGFPEAATPELLRMSPMKAHLLLLLKK